MDFYILNEIKKTKAGAVLSIICLKCFYYKNECRFLCFCTCTFKKVNAMEIWKDIEGYFGLYQVSNLGNVKSFHKGKEKILKPVKNTYGYLQVGLYKDGKLKIYKVHRLVAIAFIDNPNNYEQINHKNESKIDNHVTNLEWCDAKYNMNYGTHNQRVAEKLSKQVMCVETGIIYASANEVERELGFSNGNISSACNGKRKTCGGYTWKYVS